MVRYSGAIQEIGASLKRVGLVSTCSLAVSRCYDRFYDWSLDIETTQRRELDELDVNEDTAGRGQMYQPTGVLAFRRVMRRVQLPPSPVFVDYGCGKGRLLILAATEFSTARAVGIEFSRELCDVAEENVERVAARRSLQCAVDIVCTDAAEYRYQDDENVFYFFYPFDSELMRRVVEGIEESLRRSPRPAVLVYYYPVHAEIMEGRDLFALQDSMTVFGYDCLIYRYDPR